MTLLDRLETELLGKEIALECEEVVVKYLLPVREIFQSGEDKSQRTLRKVYQLLDSEHIVRRLKQEVEDLRFIINGIKQTT